MKLRRRDEDDDWSEDESWPADSWDEDEAEQSRGHRWLLLAGLVVLLALGYLTWSRLAARWPAAPEATAPATPAAVRTPSSAPTPAVNRATPALAAAMPTPPPPAYDPAALAAAMLDLINSDRAAAGLPPVAWDDTAAAVGAAHAADMLARDYFSHWNPEGLGPDHRYAAHGVYWVMENLHALAYTFTDGRPAPIPDWLAVIGDAQTGFMASPGHRANILHPAHTHVGIGMAYDAATSRFRLAQEFTNQHARLDAPLPAQAQPGDALRVLGEFGPAVVGNAILSLAYEPFPDALSDAELAAPVVYSSAAESVQAWAIPLAFDETLVLPAGPPGYYHVRLYADLADGQALLVDRIVAVR